MPGWRVLQRRTRWDWRHRLLAAQPELAGWSRSDIRTLVRLGDVVDVEAGVELAREDELARWFLLVLGGELALTREGVRERTVGAGGHVGAEEILGFGPQRWTVVAVAPSRLFVIRRRDLVSGVHQLPRLPRLLFPDTPPAAFGALLGDLWEQGDRDWRRLQEERGPGWRPAPGSPWPLAPPPGAWGAVDRGGRPADAAGSGDTAGTEDTGDTRDTTETADTAGTAEDGAFTTLAGRVLADLPVGARPVVADPAVPARTRVLVTAVVLAVFVGVLGVTWHPPVAVLSPGEPVDVAADIVLDTSAVAQLAAEGLTVEEPSGAYLLTPVTVDRPTLFGLVGAVVRGRTTVAVPSDVRDAGAVTRRGRAAFAASRGFAVAAVAELLDVDRERLATAVQFRARRIQGPSAGLVYTLALADMLHPADFARGRAIAATGTVAPDGSVSSVGFVELKHAAARRGGAALFLVPAGQRPAGGDPRVVEVGTAVEAVAVLRE